MSFKEAKAIMEKPAPGKALDEPVTKPEPVTEVVEELPKDVKQLPPDGVREVRKHLMQSANLYVLCVKAVDKVIAPHVPQVAQTSEQFQAAVSSLFIHATRWRLDEKMPARPL